MKITVERFDPALDAAPHQETYEVPWHEYITPLEALMYIHENITPITFDYTCRGGLCGRCTMTVDGEPAFGCIKFLDDADHTLQPLQGFPVISDLIVDKRAAQADLARAYARVRAFPLTEEEVANETEGFTPEVADRLHMTEYCCRCQACVSGCPGKKLNPSYAGPSKMVALAYRHLDPYDQGDRVVEAVQNGLWDCLMCGKCDQICENHEIKHLELIQILRDAAEERGLRPEVIASETEEGQALLAELVAGATE